MAIIFILALFSALAVVGLAGWGADSRDVRYSLWRPEDPFAQGTHPGGAR